MSFYVKTLSRENRKDFVCTDTTFEDAIAKLGEGSKVINPCYTDYGGTFLDYVAIEFYKEEHPELIESETTSWNGQNAFIKVEDDATVGSVSDVVDAVEDKYCELEYKAYRNAAESYCTEHDCHRLYDEVLDWIESHGTILPNTVDYCESRLNEYIMPQIAETMPYEVVHAVLDKEVSEEVKRLENLKWRTCDLDSDEFKSYERAVEILLNLVESYA